MITHKNLGRGAGLSGLTFCAEKPSPSLAERSDSGFDPGGKSDRVAKGLAALHQEEPIKLTPEQWTWVAEDADLEDQF
jgi:hypothetical protein